MIVGAIGTLFLTHRPIAIRALFISKVNTAGQICVAAMILAVKAVDWSMRSWLYPCLLVVAALTVVSAGAYLGQWFGHLNARQRPR